MLPTYKVAIGTKNRAINLKRFSEIRKLMVDGSRHYSESNANRRRGDQFCKSNSEELSYAPAACNFATLTVLLRSCYEAAGLLLKPPQVNLLAERGV